MSPEHFKGAVNELKAAAYFMSEGCAVYWPAVQQSPHDFIVDEFGSYRTVQVKTATWITSSGHRYLQCRTRTKGGEPPSSDYFAVIHEDEMWVITRASINSSNISLRSTGGKGRYHQWDQFKVTK